MSARVRLGVHRLDLARVGHARTDHLAAARVAHAHDLTARPGFQRFAGRGHHDPFALRYDAHGISTMHQRRRPQEAATHDVAASHGTSACHADGGVHVAEGIGCSRNAAALENEILRFEWSMCRDLGCGDHHARGDIGAHDEAVAPMIGAHHAKAHARRAARIGRFDFHAPGTRLDAAQIRDHVHVEARLQPLGGIGLLFQLAQRGGLHLRADVLRSGRESGARQQAAEYCDEDRTGRGAGSSLQPTDRFEQELIHGH